MREVNIAMLLRPDEAMVLYNAACAYCTMDKKAEAHRRAHARRGRRAIATPIWTRRDPDLVKLHGDPEFERLYPEHSS